jgi:hypothetical protein
MAYRIAGIDVHKKKLAVVVAALKSTTNTSLSDAGRVATLRTCDCFPSGWSSSKSRKW